ncbi:hypothetical protein CEUSTIGMA_g1997.t1 [Chlamydomonas eustigma]|uniref:Uncharacterized protein n=1 Tax=Chlamydomonas eustigma TaxID=1157962 RepID=A0A250WUP2_9CHLO|nr:hypothetical protein CEUSTIGMA_g1997.t1 [Chlamydomonas eustigma]|eukprot:GAX74547.1 hypothetical protein CEUSTIGMA_g1997.t1 [Chlamydomonas eustigma]
MSMAKISDVQGVIPQFRINGYKPAYTSSAAFSFAPSTTLAPRKGLAHSIVNVALSKWRKKLQNQVSGRKKNFAFSRMQMASFKAEADQAVVEALSRFSEINLQLEEERDINKINFMHQGKAELYTERALWMRHTLREDEGILKVVRAWWRFLTVRDGHEVAVIGKPVYCATAVAIQMVLLAHFKIQGEITYDPEDDWQEDNHGRDKMEFSDFFDSLFEVADMWCEKISAPDYGALLSRLLRDIQEQEERTGMFTRLLDRFDYVPPHTEPDSVVESYRKAKKAKVKLPTRPKGVLEIRVLPRQPTRCINEVDEMLTQMGVMLSQQGFQGLEEIPEWYLRYLHRIMATWCPPKSPPRTSTMRWRSPLSRSCPSPGYMDTSVEQGGMNLAASLEWPPKLPQADGHLNYPSNSAVSGNSWSGAAMSQGGLSSLYSSSSTKELHGRTGRFVRVPSVLLTPPPDLIPSPLFEPRFLTTPLLVGVVTPKGSRPTRSSFAARFVDHPPANAAALPSKRNGAKEKLLRKLPLAVSPQFLSELKVLGKSSSLTGELPPLNAQMVLDCRLLDEAVAAGLGGSGALPQEFRKEALHE